MENNFATLESQLGNDICNIEDTEEIFWLESSDDYQSKVRAGDLMIRQYRFKDAIRQYHSACMIKSDDSSLYIKLGGAYLTLFEFEEAQKNYDTAIKLGVDKRAVSFYIGIKNFFKGNFSDAVECFEDTRVDSDEMLISVIYWHTIASYRAEMEPVFLDKFKSDMNVGHHTAYKTAVSLFSKQIGCDDIVIGKSSLDAVIVLYGVCQYLKYHGKSDEAMRYMKKLLEYTDVWPSIAYLCAYRDTLYKK